ncbi:MAG: RNA-binding protein [Anaerolineae bacterium]|nr:RNA-binding protein [Thermoflexales bacterium]MDW8407836.1 RNA-binding protein [Anaerolineae bacterium]
MNTKLYVGNLSYQTTEQDLRNLFSQSGKIRSITIPSDRLTGQPRGFAFVEMETPAEALVAIKACNGKELGGREIKVNEARPPEARSGGRSNSDYNRRGNDRGGRSNRRF